MRRLLVLLLALMSLAIVARAEGPAEDFYTQMPSDLCFSQKTEVEKPEKYVTIQRMYPETSRAAVDEEIRTLIDKMAAAAEDALPERPVSDARIDAGAVISRTGTSWMSFLTLCEVTYRSELLRMDFDARAYDMSTGVRLALTDVFAKDNEQAWNLIAQGVREQLIAAFPEEEADEAALDALCDVKNLQSAPFTLGAARLMITFRADAIYPGKHTLLHAVFYYPDVRPLMTKRAQAQTDNSRYRMVAITFDDGGWRGRTRRVLEQLQLHGAQATFFVVGRHMRNTPASLMRENNAGHSVQSHTYTHRYPWQLTVAEAIEEDELFSRELSSIIGVAPTLLRAPGGHEELYLEEAFSYPLIHWSLAGGDSGVTGNASAVSSRVIHSVRDGSVVLLHDSGELVAIYTRDILDYLEKNGFLCVTVQELFADAGVPLEARRIYCSPTDIRDK